MARLLWGVVLLLAAASGHAKHEKMEPLPGLKRVIVLARHGNRAPNAPIHFLCPPYAAKVLPKFGVAPGQLSRVGMSENWESGVFLRKQFEKFLPEGRYTYDGKFRFFSERAPRNIVSTLAMAHGMFPRHTGLKGYADYDPNLVPIPTTQEGADTMMNCPRDGPCIPNLKADLAEFIAEVEPKVYQQHKELFAKVSKACDRELTAEGFDLGGGKHKNLLWGAKLINDAFSFALTEGLDPTMDGRIDLETIHEWKAMVEGVFQQANFGKPSQLTYWSSDFIPTMLTLAQTPLADAKNLLHVFLNHRELIYSTSRVLKLPIQFPGIPEGALPTGCFMGVEVYDEGVRLFYWQPTKTSFKDKAHYLKHDKPMRELYTSGGSVIPIAPPGCKAGHMCPVDVLKQTYIEHVTQTGTWAAICGVTEGQLRFAPQATKLGIGSMWLRNSSVGDKLFAPDAKALPAKLIEAPQLRTYESRMGSTNAAVALLLALIIPITGVAGWKLGRMSQKAPAEREATYDVLLG